MWAKKYLGDHENDDKDVHEAEEGSLNSGVVSGWIGVPVWLHENRSTDDCRKTQRRSKMMETTMLPSTHLM